MSWFYPVGAKGNGHFSSLSWTKMVIVEMPDFSMGLLKRKIVINAPEIPFQVTYLISSTDVQCHVVTT